MKINVYSIIILALLIATIIQIPTVLNASSLNLTNTSLTGNLLNGNSLPINSFHNPNTILASFLATNIPIIIANTTIDFNTFSAQNNLDLNTQSSLITQLALHGIPVKIQNAKAPYGLYKKNGNVLPVGSTYNISTLSYATNTATLYHIMINKTTPLCQIEIDGARFIQPTNKEFYIHPPIFPNQNTYNLTGSFSCTQLVGNPTTYTMFINLSNGTQLFASSQIGSNILIPFNYKIPSSIQATFSLQVNASANYTNELIDPVTVPANINYYNSYTFTNPNTLLATPDPYQVNVIECSSCNNHYLNSQDTNQEWFYGNGILINSWMQIGGSNTVSSTTYYLSINGFTANAGANDHITVYHGYGAMSANFMDGVVTGAAPALYGSILAGKGTLGGGVCNGNNNGYGACDNGATVFPLLYCNFQGTSPCSGWTSYGMSQSNGIVTNINGANVVTNAKFLAPNVLECNCVLPNTPPAGRAGAGFFEPDANPNNYGQTANVIAFSEDSTQTSIYAISTVGSTQIQLTGNFPSGYSSSSVGNDFSIIRQNGQDGWMYDHNGAWFYNQNANSIPLSTTAMQVGLGTTGGYPCTGCSMSYMLMRSYSPSPLIITNTVIIPTYTAPTVTITNPSNAIADVGQTETFTMTITAGTSPFTENFYIVNSITKGTILAFNSIASSSSTTSNYIFVTNTLMVSNSPLIANAVVIDSNSVPTTANSPYSSSFTVNTAPTLTVTAGTNPIVTDNMETFTLKAAGGSGKLSCAFYNQTGTQSQIGSNSLIFTIGGSNTVSFAVNTVTPANTFTYNALCYDTVTSTAYTFNSPSNTVTVNLPSTANFIIALSEAPTGTQGIGSAVTYSANLLNLNTGTSPFTLNFVYAVNNLVANSITGITANGIQTYSYTITALGTFTMNAIITDSAGASANAVAVSITGIQNQGGGGGGGGGYAFTQPTTNATVPTNVTVGTVTVQLPLLGEFSAILVQYIGILFYYHVPISTYGIPISNPLPVSYILSWEAYVGALFLLFLYGRRKRSKMIMQYSLYGFYLTFAALILAVGFLHFPLLQ